MVSEAETPRDCRGGSRRLLGGGGCDRCGDDRRVRRPLPRPGVGGGRRNRGGKGGWGWGVRRGWTGSGGGIPPSRRPALRPASAGRRPPDGVAPAAHRCAAAGAQPLAAAGLQPGASGFSGHLSLRGSPTPLCVSVQSESHPRAAAALPERDSPGSPEAPRRPGVPGPGPPLAARAPLSDSQGRASAARVAPDLRLAGERIPDSRTVSGPGAPTPGPQPGPDVWNPVL